MAETMRQEVVASLKSEVILVDRPVPDALGYLVAALEYTDRRLDNVRLERLEGICTSWVGEYDLLFLTKLDESVPLATGRESDEVFRTFVGEAIGKVVGRVAPEHKVLRRGREKDALALAMRVATPGLGR